MAWFELALDVPESVKDGVVNRLFELGAEGLDESDKAGDASLVSLKGYFSAAAGPVVEREVKIYLESVSEIFPEAAGLKWSSRLIQKENWAERYKEFYHAQRLTNSFFLKPAWEGDAVVPDGMLPIILEPGQAFGTGLHASTRLSLKLLENVVDQLPDLSSGRAVDVGTGSGILAIAAQKLGLRHVEAIDIDPIAVTAANENFVLNGCRGITASTQSLSSIKGPFDVILSNILLETHRELAREYQRLLAPGGALILSGLLTPQRAELLEVMAAFGLAEESSEYLQEWMAIVLRRAQ